jgi:putative spermidine/putrescine transport system permease protein
LYALGLTTVASISVTLASLIFGTAVAVLWYLEGPNARRFITSILLSTVVTGLIVRNYGWIGLLSTPRLGLGSLLYTLPATLAVMTLALSPLSYFVVRLGLDSVKSDAIDAARTLGASDLRILRRVVLSQLRSSILLSVVLTFSVSMSYFITPSMLGGTQYYFIGNLIVRVLDDSGDYVSASVIGLYMIIPLIALSALAWAMGRRRGSPRYL